MQHVRLHITMRKNNAYLVNINSFSPKKKTDNKKIFFSQLVVADKTNNEFWNMSESATVKH